MFSRALRIGQGAAKQMLVNDVAQLSVSPIVLRTLSTKASATFQTKPYKLHRMDEGPSTDVTCTREDALNFYREMTMVRRLEAAANALYKEKAVRGFCHLYTGQEAVCVGMEAAIT